jgi:ribosome-associated protein
LVGSWLASFLRIDRPTMPATLTKQQARSLNEACLCAKLAEDFRGRDTVVLDLTAITPIVDYFVISTSTNPRAMTALLDEVRVMMKARGNRPLGTEGADSASSWQLQDYGDIVVHAFLSEARAMYDLEGLWADAPRVDWKQHLQQMDADE